MQSLDLALELFPAPDAVESGTHAPGEGADFVINEITAALKSIKAEGSLLAFLDSLLDLKGSPYLQTLRRSTRLSLQVTPCQHYEVLCEVQSGSMRNGSCAHTHKMEGLARESLTSSAASMSQHANHQ